MIRVAEFTAFLALAAGLHLALWWQSTDGTPDAAGEGRAAALSLMASSPALADLVAAWDSPPDAVEAVQTLAAPPMPAAAVPLKPAMPQARAPRTAPSAPALPSAAPALPSVQTTAPPPPAQPPGTRPRQRPETLARAAQRPEPAPKPATEAAEATEKQTAKPAAEARASQTASGQGQTSQAGTSASSAQASLAPAQSASLLAQWGSEVRTSIERRKRFPNGTRANGTVRLQISVQTSGQLASVHVARSSGDAALDQTALTAVQRARLPPAPRGLAPGAHSFALAMSFQP